MSVGAGGHFCLFTCEDRSSLEVEVNSGRVALRGKRSTGRGERNLEVWGEEMED